jgi:hypothetical protein
MKRFVSMLMSLCISVTSLAAVGHAEDPVCFIHAERSCNMPHPDLHPCNTKECYHFVEWEFVMHLDEECDLMRPRIKYRCHDNTKEAFDFFVQSHIDCHTVAPQGGTQFAGQDDEQEQVCYRTRFCDEECTVTTQVIDHEYYRDNCDWEVYDPYEPSYWVPIKRAICKSTDDPGLVGPSFNWFPCITFCPPPGMPGSD